MPSLGATLTKNTACSRRQNLGCGVTKAATACCTLIDLVVQRGREPWRLGLSEETGGAGSCGQPVRSRMATHDRILADETAMNGIVMFQWNPGWRDPLDPPSQRDPSSGSSFFVAALACGVLSAATRRSYSRGCATYFRENQDNIQTTWHTGILGTGGLCQTARRTSSYVQGPCCERRKDLPNAVHCRSCCR
jgi:hypothetical protein